MRRNRRLLGLLSLSRSPSDYFQGMVKKSIELEFVVRIAYRVSVLDDIVGHVTKSLFCRFSNMTHEVWSKSSQSGAKGVNRDDVSPTYYESNTFGIAEDWTTIPFHTEVCIDNAYLWRRRQV